MTSDLEHPCKETCSGWKQGREVGLTESRKENEALRELLERAMDLVVRPVDQKLVGELLSDYNALPENKG